MIKGWVGLAAVVLMTVGMAGGPRAASEDDLAAEQKRLQAELEQRRQQVDEVRRQLAEIGRQQQELARLGATDPNATQFHLPRLRGTPAIDGVIHEEEWAGAIGVPLTAGLNQIWKRPSSMFLLGWDDEHLFLAQRLPLREGERLVRLNRESRHDHVAPHETSLEVYVDRKSHGSHGSGCRWQFMGNAVGNRWEREDQYEIGQNFIGWDGEWQYAQRLTPDGKFWEAEIAIPRRTVYQESPLKDGDRWWIGLATNLHRPWTWSGFYGWKIPATFAESTPEIRLSDVSRSQTVRGIAFDLQLRNTTAQPFTGRLVARLLDPKAKDPARQVLAEFERPLDLAPGAASSLSLDEAVDPKFSGGRLAIVVEREGRSIYTWGETINYTDPLIEQGVAYTPDESAFPLKAAYNPLSDYVRVEVDIYDLTERETVVKARFGLRPEGDGPVLGEGEIVTFDQGKGEARIPTPADLQPGNYICVAELLTADGRVVATERSAFVRKDHARDFPWLFDNTLGEQAEVLPPFEPLRVADRVIGAFRKEIQLDGSALPARIVAAGVELLRAPIGIEGVADGQPFVLRPGETGPRLVAGSPVRAEYEGTAAGGPLTAAITTRWEYDSTCKVELTLRPREGATARFEALRLVIPMTAEGGINYMANGLNMRLSNQAGTIPGAGQAGVVWGSTSVPYQQMTVGSFVPFVWVGNLSSGITWFADSDRGWWPSEAAPAIAFERDPEGRVSLVLNLASAPVELGESRRLVFGLNVNPVRPYSDHQSSSHTFGFLEETGRWVRGRQPRNFARRYPDDPELNRKTSERSKRVGKIYAPYTEMSWADFEPDVVEYFKEEWDRFGLGGPLFVKTSNDYLIWLFDRWIRDCDVDGLYFDNVYNKMNYNSHAGTAYVLPDGRTQPGYNLWGMRDHIIRTRGVLEARKGGAPYRICIHNTRFQFAPIMGFADLAMGGEMPTPSGTNPGAGDWMDMHSRDFMDVMYNVPLWGYKLNHLYHFRRESYTDAFGEPDEEAATRVHRGAMASMLIHGVEFFQGQGDLSAKFKLLKEVAGGLTFAPEWDAGGRFRLAKPDPDLAIAVWHGQDVLLVIVANHGRKEKVAEAWLDFPNLIRPPAPRYQRHLWDFETFAGFTPWSKRGDGALVDREFPDDKLPRLDEGADTTVNIPNTIRLRIAPRDFRAVLVTNLPLGGSGSGF